MKASEFDRKFDAGEDVSDAIDWSLAQRLGDRPTRVQGVRGAMEEERTTGQCLCGGVTFRIVGKFETFFLCHCTRCRKGSGSAHSANLFSTTAKVKWLSGAEKIKKFEVSGSRHARNFCNDCGSALPIFQEELGLLVTPAGSLDSRIDISPNAHICFSSRAAWDNDLSSIERIDGLPD